MSLLLTDAYVVTMDDEDTELDGGWILVRDGLVEALGSRRLDRKSTRLNSSH